MFLDPSWASLAMKPMVSMHCVKPAFRGESVQGKSRYTFIGRPPLSKSYVTPRGLDTYLGAFCPYLAPMNLSW